ncbi:FAD-binding protein, partial [Streptomyces sp. T-3]|nr:FAD-binding protein [Streptomyces sp. T-3]
MSLDAGAPGAHNGDGHAVVIGSGLAGLTAAQALAHSFATVTVIERDRLPRGPRRRRGAAQARHAHALMSAAHQGLELLLPGITARLLAAGAVRVRVPEDMLLLGPRGWLPRFDTGLTMLTGTLDVVESVVRDRVRAHPKVTFLQEHEVIGLEPGRDDTVTGVRVRAKDPAAPGGWGGARLMPADFVVDACGHASRAPQWLAELGYQVPTESLAAAPATYVTSLFAPPVGHVADWSCMVVMPSPEHPQHGILSPVEGGRWMVSVSAGAAPPPADHAGLLQAAGRLGDGLLREVVETATPLGPVYSSARSVHRWRHYEKLRRWPDQFLVVGDAVGTLGACYGHGMSLAVQSAVLLDQMLVSHGTHVGLAYRLRRALAHQLLPAWQLAAGGHPCLRHAGSQLPDGPRSLAA